MSKIEAEPKFEIGDVVTFRAMGEFWDCEKMALIQIVERLVQQCYGGIQIQYLCRVMGYGDTGSFGYQVDLKRFVESELMAFPSEALKERRAELSERAKKRREKYDFTE